MYSRPKRHKLHEEPKVVEAADRISNLPSSVLCYSIYPQIMYSQPKRHKLHEEAKVVEAADRISNLPSSVLCHILSFLPTEDTVRTSILSTRWKYLFASTPNLNFDDSSLRLHTKKASGKSLARQSQCFLNFVYRMLLLRNTLHINRFRLNCYLKYDIQHLNAWIRAALFHNVHELDLQIPLADLVVLPYDLFTCQTLVVLKLYVMCELRFPTKVPFPRLKILHLRGLLFVDDYLTKMLFSGCPVLEDLHISHCRLNNVLVIDISNSTLKRLLIERLHHDDDDSSLSECEYDVFVDAPCLEYLKYIDYVAKCYNLKNLNSLVEAHIDITKIHQMHSPILDFGWHIGHLVRGISKVETLHLSAASMKAFDILQCPLPTFPNLIHLELGSFNEPSIRTGGWQLLLKFLEISPNLQVLVFPHVSYEGFSYDSRMGELKHCLIKHLPSCLSLHLREIKIMQFSGGEDELTLVGYFLKSAKVLEKMTIRSFKPPETVLSISEKLLMFPRCSRSCQIKLMPQHS